MTHVYDATLLSGSKVYLIEGCLYRYISQSGKVNSPSYRFEPLAGQRRQADIVLSRNRLMTRVQETHLKAGDASPGHIQLSLL